MSDARTRSPMPMIVAAALTLLVWWVTSPGIALAFLAVAVVLIIVTRLAADRPQKATTWRDKPPRGNTGFLDNWTG